METIWGSKKFMFWQFALIAAGAFSCAAGINLFLVPHHFLSGGVSGLSILISYLTNFNIGILVFLFNIPVFLFGMRHMGRRFMFGSLVGTVLFSVFIEATSWMTKLNATHEPWLAAIFGGALGGIGIGLSFRGQGSLGGADIISAVVRKKWSVSIGTVTFLVNAGIILAGGILFGVEIALATIVGLAIQVIAIDKVIAGFTESKALFIMSDKYEEIAAYLIQKLNRGVTYLEGEGAYSHQRQRVVYAVITLPQLSRVKYFVKRADPHAFLVVADVTEVQGHGFKPMAI